MSGYNTDSGAKKGAIQIGLPLLNGVYDMSLWFKNSGQRVIDGIITELNARGHSGLTINEERNLDDMPGAAVRH